MKNDLLDLNYIDITSGVNFINPTCLVNGVKNMFVIVIRNDTKLTQGITKKLLDNRADIATVGLPIEFVINDKL